MKLKMSNEAYDSLSWVAIVLLPLLVVFYTTLGTLWEWPKTTEVAGSIAALDALLGGALKKSNSDYKKEQAEIEEF